MGRIEGNKSKKVSLTAKSALKSKSKKMLQRVQEPTVKELEESLDGLHSLTKDIKSKWVPDKYDIDDLILKMSHLTLNFPQEELDILKQINY